MLLATTALEWTWKESDPLLFLGEWCRRFERTSVWSAREHRVIRNHWDDRDKLRHDHDYLGRLHADVLDRLAVALGRVHGIERTRRFWRTLLDPWLIRYLGAAFDRWESLRIAFEEHDISETLVRARPAGAIARGHPEFIDLLDDDDWNHDFFLDILQRYYADRCELRVADVAWREESLGLAAGPIHATPSLKWRLVRAADRFAAACSRRSRLLFVQSYFSIQALIALNLRLRQVPSLFLQDFEWPDGRTRRPPASDSALRAAARLQREPANAFEEFLNERIARDLPQALLEEFATLRAHSRAIRLHPKVVFTGTAHWFSDPFKHWVAERVHQGMRLVTVDHGGSLHPAFGIMDFEEDIAEVKATWSRPYRSKQVQMPATKYAGRRRKRPDGKRLVAIGYELPRYSFAAWSGPIGGQTLLGVDYICRLHDALDEPAREALLVKPYPNLGWCTRQRFIQRLGERKVSPEPRLDTVLREARMIVCTYPQTTFSDAMVSGAPSVLVYHPHHWETVPMLDELIEALRAARIVFFDPTEAAAHINSVWNAPQAWWDTSAVRAVRERFAAEILDLGGQELQRWAAFARHVASSNDLAGCSLQKAS